MNSPLSIEERESARDILDKEYSNKFAIAMMDKIIDRFRVRGGSYTLEVEQTYLASCAIKRYENTNDKDQLVFAAICLMREYMKDV